MAQVAERALQMWHNANTVPLIQENVEVIMPVAFEPLYRSSKLHWHKQIHGLALASLRVMMRMNPALFDQCSNNYRQQRQLYGAVLCASAAASAATSALRRP